VQLRLPVRSFASVKDAECAKLNYESEEKMKASLQSVLVGAGAALLCLGAAGCGNNVSGHTYAGNGEMVKIEFQSDGKAFASMGPITSSCIYTQASKRITLTCEGDTEQLTVADDGSLNGPPDGMLAHLTKVK